MSPLRAGDRIGDFTLIAPAGRGTSAEVWQASTDRSGGHGATVVALKLLADPIGPDDPQELRERFIEEGRIAQALRHPDIVAWLGSGEHEGRPWMALEWLPGEDLSRHTRRDALLPGPEAVRIAQRLALALDHAHRQGIVHRDLKPDNVRIDLPRGVVKLTDFGIARQQDSTRTRTGLFLGTPAYMAPELLAGAGADARTDLYALGVVLFELLTGRRPLQASSMGELLQRLSREAAPALRSLRADAPMALSEELAAWLQRDRALRPASAALAAQALAALPTQWP